MGNYAVRIFRVFFSLTYFRLISFPPYFLSFSSIVSAYFSLHFIPQLDAFFSRLWKIMRSAFPPYFRIIPYNRIGPHTSAHFPPSTQNSPNFFPALGIYAIYAFIYLGKMCDRKISKQRENWHFVFFLVPQIFVSSQMYAMSDRFVFQEPEDLGPRP